MTYRKGLLMRLPNVWQLLKRTFSEWSEDKVPQLGAALAFYSALSLAPLLVIALAIAGLFLGEEAARGQIVNELQSLVGPAGGKAIESMIQNASKPETGIIASVLSIATLLFGASGVFGQLQDSLNTIWEVKPKEGRGFWGMIRDRFLSFTMVMGVAFLLLVSLLISAGLASLGMVAERLPEAVQWIAQLVNFVVSFIVITVLFAMMFKLLPDVKMAWRDVWLGAIVTAVLFMLGK